MPARTSMFTGLLPRDHGVRINGQSPRPGLPYLPEVLRQAGYRTHAAGKLHLTPYMPRLEKADPARYPEDLEAWTRGEIQRIPTPYFGFEEVAFVGGHTEFVFGQYIQWVRDRGGDPSMLRRLKQRGPHVDAPQCYRMAMPVELHYNRYIADATIAFIESQASDKSEPFFAFCSIPDPHAPVAPPAPYDTLYDPADVPLPAHRPGETDDLPAFYQDVFCGKLRPNGENNYGVGEQQIRQILALTFGMISHLDVEIGRVLRVLDRYDLWNDTIVVFVSDHGDMMGDHGLLWKAFYTFQGCIRIPTLVAAPGVQGGVTCDALISQIDLMPSLLDLAGVAAPGEMWRRAHTPFQRGAHVPLETYPGRSWRQLLHDPSRRIRDHVVIENDDASTGLRPRCLVTERHRLTSYAGQPYGELYDLENDPDELRNLWDLPQASDLRRRLLHLLLDAQTIQTPWHPVPPWNS
jgi:arylsulfatase A-like enzyme